VTAVLEALVAHLPSGHEHAVPGPALAEAVGVTYRQLQQLVAEAIEAGIAVGSTCNGPRPGFYRMRPGNIEDFRIGVAHIVKRAGAMFARVRALERIRAHEFPAANRLFDLDDMEVPA
jgi:hypothetical protein